MVMEQWYTLYTKPFQERKVAAALEESEIVTFLPLLRSQKAQSRPQATPLFPCYLFMRVDLDNVNPSRWHWTPGLRSIVAFDGEPVPVSDQAIDLIHSNLDQLNQAAAQPRPAFKEGDVVRVTSGPFADLLAVFEGPKTASERVTILLEFLGQVSRVRLNVSELERASQNADLSAAPRRPRRTRGRGRRIKEPATNMSGPSS